VVLTDGSSVVGDSDAATLGGAPSVDNAMEPPYPTGRVIVMPTVVVAPASRAADDWSGEMVLIFVRGAVPDAPEQLRRSGTRARRRSAAVVRAWLLRKNRKRTFRCGSAHGAEEHHDHNRLPLPPPLNARCTRHTCADCNRSNVVAIEVAPTSCAPADRRRLMNGLHSYMRAHGARHHLHRAARPVTGRFTRLFALPLALAACHPSPPVSASATSPRAIARARADSARYPYTAADIAFMTGMIAHHSQAIVMASMAPTHGASPSVATLAARIITSQQDDIALMQRWLRDRGQPVPEGSPQRMSTMPVARMDTSHMDMSKMDMSKMDMAHRTADAHDHTSAGMGAMMPGMLTDAQLRELDAARGTAWDERFLTFMMQHHHGALTMVQQLLTTDGAAQDEAVFKFASDVNVDQTTEIARMERMLFLLKLEKKSP
jgi:uncharacterized protein (DUF305 family)